MTKEQFDIINLSLLNLKLFCKSQNYCVDCPMYKNCRCKNSMAEWETIKYEEA